MINLIDLEEKSDKMNFETAKRSIELFLLSPERGSMQKAVNVAAKYILSINKICCIRQDDQDEFWIYKDGIYVPEGKTYIYEMCDSLFHVAYTAQKANSVCAKIKVSCFIDSKFFFSQQEKYPHLLAVNNGILNLKTRELIPFSSEYFFFNKLNIDYDSTVKCDNFIKFVEQITGSSVDVLVIQELFGFCLLKDYLYEKAFMFYGANGRNGKSKLLEILSLLVGKSNVVNLSLQDIEKKPFSICNLQHKLVNIGSDISNEALSFTGIFKKITGRDTLSANRKNKSYVEFKNYAKLIFTANELPPITTLSDAFWLRWVIIEFPYQFLPQKEIDALPVHKRSGVFLQDPSIIDSLTTTVELQGILNWAIDGLSRLMKNKDFSNKETAKMNHLIWLRRSNSVAAFLFDCVVEDADSCISKREFKNRYLAYCHQNVLKTLPEKVIKRTIEAETGSSDFRDNVLVEGVGYEKVSYWGGIRFKDSVVVLGDDFVSDRLSVRKSMGDVVEFRSGNFRRL